MPLEEISDEFVGFVYVITNLTNNRKYIGKKLTKFSRKKSIKGKKKRVVIDSDWKDYYGSSNELLEDLEKHGKDSFKREIIRLCKTKGACSYYEAKEQFLNGVLESPELWYNGQIRCRIHSSHIKKDLLLETDTKI